MPDQRQDDADRILQRFEPMDNSMQDDCNSADQYRRQYKLSEALLLCTSGIDAAAELGSPQAEGICLLHRWAVHYVGMKFPEAIEDCREAQKRFESVDDGFGEINAAVALGLTYERQGAFLKSRSLAAKAMAAYQNAKHAYRYDIAQAIVNELRHRPRRGRGLPTVEQYEELLEDLKAGHRRVTNRYVQLVPVSSTKPLGDLLTVPVLAQPIPAGKPVPTLDEIESYAQIISDRASIGSEEYRIQLLGTGRGSGFKVDPKGCCYLIVPVAGTSMDHVDIRNRDLVLLRLARGATIAPTPGDIVAAVIQGEDRVVTLKRYVERSGKFILNAESSDPANKSYEFDAADFAANVVIAGIAIAVLKTL